MKKIVFANLNSMIVNDHFKKSTEILNKMHHNQFLKFHINIFRLKKDKRLDKF